jgi:hypothetical protein
MFFGGINANYLIWEKATYHESDNMLREKKRVIKIIKERIFQLKKY